MRKLLLALATAGSIGLFASAVPANAAPLGGLTAPSVESNTVDVNCRHRRHRSSWRCYNPHYYYSAPLYQPFYYHHHRWHHRRHWRHRHHHRRHRHW